MVAKSSLAIAFLPIDAIQVTKTLPLGTILALVAPDSVSLTLVFDTYFRLKSSAVAQDILPS